MAADDTSPTPDGAVVTSPDVPGDAAAGVSAPVRRAGSGVTGVLLKAAGLFGVFAVVQGLIVAGVIDDFTLITIITICINIVLAASLNLITGFTGQFSLGHAGFMALGAYVTAFVTIAFPTPGGFVVGLLLGGGTAALVGLLIGLPTLRLRGDYLAIATLGMAEIIRVTLLNLDVTNGAAGLNDIPLLLDWPSAFLLTAGTLLLIRNFLRSRHGRDCVAVREDEIAAESVGVSSTYAKVLAFVVGAFFGGVAGGMYASYFFFIKPDQFGFLKSIDILVIVVLGGMGSLSGSVIAAALLGLLSTATQSVPAIRMIVYGLVLVGIMVFRPQGIMGDRELTWSALRRLVPARLRGGRGEERP